MSSNLLLYCRPGFEKECAAEIMAGCARLGVDGYAKAKPESGLTLYVPHDGARLQRSGKQIRWDNLVFARQLLFQVRLIEGLPNIDRVLPLVTAARELGIVFSDVWLETPDTNDAKALSTFCRKLTPPLRHGLQQAGLLSTGPGLPRLHVCWLSAATCYLGVAYPKNAAPWPLGIPRLRMPRTAPSRSTLKLAEAFLLFLSEHEQAQYLHEGLSAVDLGASPGGWTWQLVQRGLQVTAVDNGPMDADLMASGQVEHLREDGLRYWPKRPVDWLVCDMVDKPARIAELVGHWAATGKCRQAIFNLKLPMKKRWEELQHCRDLIDAAMHDKPHRLRFKQLYHDREEVTGYLCVCTR